MIERHKTAIRRSGLSLPVKCILRDSLLDEARSLFDYGCGHGQDIDLLASMGFSCGGWDPMFRPATEKARADIVNLGYVINVIEDPMERREVLHQAWELCDEVLVVSALGVSEETEGANRVPYGDGALTARGTFQKHYLHTELRSYLQEHLPVDPVPAAPNIFYLFKSEEIRHQFLARRNRRTLAIPKQRISEQLFEQHKALLEPFMAALAQLGRLPGPDELAEHVEIDAKFGSLKRAFQIVVRVTGKEPWAEITARRKEDLLVYLALARFGSRKPLTKLPVTIQRDIKAFVGTYQQAREEANALLFSVGNTEVIDQACRNARKGCLVDNALIVARNDLAALSPTLRVFEGCARAVLGEVDEANVVKLHRYSGKVSYLVCPDLEHDANPAVRLRIKVNLRTLDIDFFDYALWNEQPRLNITP